MVYSSIYNSPIGKLTILCDESNVLGLWIKGQKYFGNNILEKAIVSNNQPILIQTKKWLDRYFKGKNPQIEELPLKPIGGDFRQIVWKILCKIPYGQTTTYGNIAKEVAKILKKDKMSAQAIGGAVGHNPISIIIPCYRVIGSKGNLTGYAGGIDIKKKLLDFEKNITKE